MVFSPPLIFSEAQYYSQHPDDCILLLPPDFEQQADALQSSPDPYLHQRLLLNLSQFYPMQFWRLYNLKAYASEVALIEPSQDVLDALQQAGFQVGGPFLGAAEGRVSAVGRARFSLFAIALRFIQFGHPDR